MGTIRLQLAYDGTDFAGWQIQPDARTVQGVLEAAIEQLTGESVRVLSAGRTDAGVHALGQVASFRTAASIPPEKWRPALQSLLPPDVVVLSSETAGDDFHATYSAVSKRYRYLIRTSVVDDPFLRRYAWRIGGDLDVGRMRSAAQALLGTHDFRCFESHWPNKATSVRTVLDVSLAKLAHWPGWGRSPVSSVQCPEQQVSRDASVALDTGLSTRDSYVSFEIEADGFLYNMVRAIVGTLVNVGRGKWPVESLGEIIAGQDRSRAGETAPPEGLYLVYVKYPARP
jgi:tRNA pseudouridine38-40 synthase